MGLPQTQNMINKFWVGTCNYTVKNKEREIKSFNQVK